MHDDLKTEVCDSLIYDTDLDIDKLAIKYNVSKNTIVQMQSDLRKEASSHYKISTPSLNNISKLIGEHPTSGFFFDWCQDEDIPSTDTKKHRKLIDKGIDRDILINELSDFILKHHISPLKVKKFEEKKSILNKHQFNNYLDKRMPFPVQNLTTQKGNLGEIILAEYLEASSGLEVVVFKLHFNPNIEQAMKGDDILLFDKKNISNKMIMGEAKYRGTPTKQVVMDVINSLSKDNLPISLTFVSDRLMELGEINLSEEIDDLIDKVIMPLKSKTTIQ